ncbi:MAG: hypothetical protein U0003_05535 [Vampirovibrionales bacterium]
MTSWGNQPLPAMGTTATASSATASPRYEVIAPTTAPAPPPAQATPEPSVCVPLSTWQAMHLNSTPPNTAGPVLANTMAVPATQPLVTSAVQPASTVPIQSTASPTVVQPQSVALATSPTNAPSVNPFTQPMPGIPTPEQLAPWAFYKPAPCPRTEGLNTAGSGSPPQDPSLSGASQPLNNTLNTPPVAPPNTLPNAAPTPTDEANAAAKGLVPDGSSATDATNGAQGAPALPNVGNAFPLTPELVNQWSKDLEDRHPVISRRSEAATQLGNFLLQHPEVTLEGQPRAIMERLVNNVLSTGRFGNDTDERTTVERDVILIALKNGGFYNLPASIVEPLQQLAKHSTALHGMEQQLAQEILTKHAQGDYTPTAQTVERYEQQYPWVVGTRQPNEGPPKVKAAEGVPSPPPVSTPEISASSATTEAPIGLLQPPIPPKASLWQRLMGSPKTVTIPPVVPAAPTTGGQRLNIVSQP